jgi:hypothetical protein
MAERETGSRSGGERAKTAGAGVSAPGEAWERGKGCSEYIAETFRRGSVGNQSHPVELASSRKQALRGVGRPPTRSVGRQTESSDMEPRNSSRREPSLLTQAGAASARCHGLACRSHRGPRPERTVTRTPQEPGRPALSVVSFLRFGVAPLPKPLALRTERLPPGGAKDKARRRYRWANTMSPGRRRTRGRSVSYYL